MEDLLKKISIRGRVAFCLACLHNALQQEGINFILLQLTIDRIRNFLTTSKLDEWEQKAVEVSPDTIFDTHPDNNFDDYATLTRSEIEVLKNIYTRLPKSILQLIDLTISVGLANLYGGTGEFSSHSLKPTMSVIEAMREFGYKIPDIREYSQFDFSKNNGWGNPQPYLA